MSNQLLPPPKDGLIAKFSLTLGIAFLFLVFRYLSRQREERRLVRIPQLVSPIRHLDQLSGGGVVFPSSVWLSTGTAWKMASLAGPAHQLH